MSEDLDSDYLTWLYGLVRWDEHGDRTYWKLLRQMHSTEFIWFIPNDDNRAEDGRALRWEFFDSTNAVVDRDWLDLGCSFLEMLIGVARRLSFENDYSTPVCFWNFVGSLRLDGYDDNSVYRKNNIDRVLNRVVFRTYSYDGTGGLFPLRHATEDQREIEIWYQLSAWLLETV